MSCETLAIDIRLEEIKKQIIWRKFYDQIDRFTNANARAGLATIHFTGARIMMSKFFICSATGKYSMMRMGFAVSMVVGSAVSIAGAVAMFIDATHAGTAITAGLALVGSGGWAKAVQSKYEGVNHADKPTNN